MRSDGYQPQWINGKEVGTGWRDCNGRYEALKNYLLKIGMQSPRVLEIGAYTGYFCRRLAEDFNARCTAVDNHPGLVEYPGVEVVHRLVNPTQIACMFGHFDVVICMSVLHHHKNWPEYIQALLQAGDVVFIETANPLEHFGQQHREYALGAYREISKIAKVLTQTPPMNGEANLRPLWVVDQITQARDDEEKIQIMATAMRALFSRPDDVVTLTLTDLERAAEVIVKSLGHYSWDMIYNPEKTKQAIARMVANYPLPTPEGIPPRAPERLDG